jgi:hypothetical protein
MGAAPAAAGAKVRRPRMGQKKVNSQDEQLMSALFAKMTQGRV